MSSVAKKSSDFLIIKNNKVTDLRTPKNEFLESFKTGTYVTMRTMGKGKIYELDSHVARLAYSNRNLLEKAKSDKSELALQLINPEILRPRVIAAARTSVLSFDSTFPGSDELRLTALITWDPHTLLDFDAFVYVEPLPLPPKPPIDIMLRFWEKSAVHGANKDLHRVQDRKELESVMGSYHEIVTTTEHGDVLEGTQSNFFVVQSENEIVTAPEPRVLPGTIRSSVLRVCQANGIKVHLQCANLAQLFTWQGCFLTSTTRIVVPVDSLSLPADGLPYPPAPNGRLVLPDPLCFKPSSLIRRINDLVLEDMKSHCAEILS